MSAPRFDGAVGLLMNRTMIRQAITEYLDRRMASPVFVVSVTLMSASETITVEFASSEAGVPEAVEPRRAIANELPTPDMSFNA